MIEENFDRKFQLPGSDLEYKLVKGEECVKNMDKCFVPSYKFYDIFKLWPEYKKSRDDTVIEIYVQHNTPYIVTRNGCKRYMHVDHLIPDSNITQRGVYQWKNEELNIFHSHGLLKNRLHYYTYEYKCNYNPYILWTLTDVESTYGSFKDKGDD